jgi:hypothetical protein
LGGIQVLELDELLDMLLRIAGLESLEAGLFQVVDGRCMPRTKYIRRRNDRWNCIRDGAQSISDSFCGLWIPRIASNPDRATLLWANWVTDRGFEFLVHWVLCLERFDQALLFPPFRAVLSL